MQTRGSYAREVPCPFEGKQQTRRFINLDLIARQTRDVMSKPVGRRRSIGDLVPLGQGANCGGGIVEKALLHALSVPEIEMHEKRKRCHSAWSRQKVGARHARP